MPCIVYRGREICFILKRKKVKNINIRVKPSGEVIVSAHPTVPMVYIETLLYKKMHWIEKHLNFYKEMDRKTLSTEKRNKGREKEKKGFLYLGKEYSLYLVASSQKKVEVKGDRLYVYMKDIQDRAKMEKWLRKWYKEECKKLFRESLDRMYEKVKEYNIEYPHLYIRKMTRRWGTCYYTENKIILNSALGKAPQECIDQVVLHELIHFKHHNHSKDFYDLLSTLMPDWKERKRILEASTAREW